jgi:hypothetical protein
MTPGETREKFVSIVPVVAFEFVKAIKPPTPRAITPTDVSEDDEPAEDTVPPEMLAELVILKPVETPTLGPTVNRLPPPFVRKSIKLPVKPAGALVPNSVPPVLHVNGAPEISTPGVEAAPGALNVFDAVKLLVEGSVAMAKPPFAVLTIGFG